MTTIELGAVSECIASIVVLTTLVAPVVQARLNNAGLVEANKTFATEAQWVRSKSA